MIIYDIALTMTPRLGSKGIVRLLEVFGSAEKIFSATATELVHFAALNAEIADSIVRRTAFAHAEREVAYCQRHGITPLAATDERYPPLLREVEDRPHVIYVVGHLEALAARTVSVVGTRRISSYGDRICNELVRDLSERASNICIVSGLAYGVDAAAHRAALTHGIATVAVLASPLPGVTPVQHTSLAADIVESGGALVSEQHSQSRAHKNSFIARNRIVAALSGVTVVVESPTTGGSMVTASMAHGYSRSVMAIPGRLTDPSSAGCNMLIRNNVASLYFGADQIIREMMWDGEAPTDRVAVESLPADLTPEDEALLSTFDSSDPMTLEALSDATNIAISKLSSQLLQLELQGLVRMLPGSRYERLRVVVTK